MPLLHVRRLATAHFLLTGLMLSACSAKPPPPRPPTDTEHLSKIERAYDIATQRLGRPPANEEQLKPFLIEFGDPADILRSPRDGRPYVIVYGVHIRKPFEMPPPIWAHEASGVDGQRYVMTVMGVALMSDEEFSSAKFVKP